MHPKSAHASLARTVDGDDHATGVSGTIGGQKDRHVGDFAWPGCAPEREASHQFAIAIFIAQLVPGTSFHQGDVTIGFDRSRIDPNNANAIVQAFPAERLGEGHQGRVASAAGDVIVVEALTGRANDVDHYALVARLHAGVNEAG